MGSPSIARLPAFQNQPGAEPGKPQGGSATHYKAVLFYMLQPTFELVSDAGCPDQLLDPNAKCGRPRVAKRLETFHFITLYYTFGGKNASLSDKQVETPPILYPSYRRH